MFLNMSYFRERNYFKMMAMLNRVLDWIRSLFWSEEMELTLVGLQGSGKTTFVNVIAVRLLTKNLIICVLFLEWTIH